MSSGLFEPDVIDDLSRWITHQRWYANKGATIETITLDSQTQIPLAGTSVTHVVAQIHTLSGIDRYQLLLRWADTPYVDEHVTSNSVICHDSVEKRSLYELFGDVQRLVELQSLFETRAQVGSMSFHSTAQFNPVKIARVVATEQSNSSVIFGDQAIAKFYRRLGPGTNPDLEIGLALSGDHTPRVLGWISGDVEAQETTLAIVHEYLPTAVDGFEYALGSVRDLMATPELEPEAAGADFAAEALRLGESIARLHQELAQSFGTAQLTPEDLARLTSTLNARLDEAVRYVPALTQYEKELRNIFHEISAPFEVQRIHGDLHLGQVLRDSRGWMVLDFEGEPGTPLHERRAFASALRDVAGMLRSFDYAAHQPLIGHPTADLFRDRNSRWAERNRQAFLRGYTAFNAVDLAHYGSLLRAFEAEKAVYESVYEHRFRPDWIGVPLGGIERLVEGR